MNELFALVWIIVTAISAVAFSIVRKLDIIWACPAALVAAVIAYSDKSLVWQLLAFAVLYALGLVVYRVIDEKIGLSEVNIDNVIGLSCSVSERIDNYAGSGQVLVKGRIWAARAVSDDDVYEAGQRLSVVAIEGARLVCKSKK